MAKIFPKIETVSLESEFGDEKGFTEWLANKETNGLQLLGEAVGIELAFEGLEVSTGQFRIDIVANSTDDNSKVIIENQIEATNHKHLGQCLTYASAFDDCKTIIWIAKKFNDEHKRAIDWLNKSWSDTGISFYAVEVKLIKIGNSGPSPVFIVVCQPDKSSRAIIIQESTSELGKFQINFWQSYVETLKKVKIHSGHQIKDSALYWVGIGSKWACLNPRVNKNEGKATIAIWVNRQPNLGDTERVFNFIELHKQEIETAVGEPLDWTQKEGGKIKVITLIKNGFDFDHEAGTKQAIDWLVDKTNKLNKCLRKILPKFNVGVFQESESSDDSPVNPE